MNCLRPDHSFEGHRPVLIAFDGERIRNVEREREHVTLRGVRRILNRLACHGRALARGYVLPVQQRETPQRVEARLESHGVRALYRPPGLLDAPFDALQSSVDLHHIHLAD